VRQRLDAGEATARTRLAARPRERFEGILRHIRKDPSFAKFLTDPNGLSLTEMDIRRLLGCTMETPVRVLRQNVNSFKTAAAEYGDDEVHRFMNVCESRVRELVRRR